MTKRKGILIGVGIVGALAGGIIAFLAANSRESHESDAVILPSQIKRPLEGGTSDLSLDEATALMAETTGDNPLFDLYQPYINNNMIFLDGEAPCNKGAEALQSFVLRFSQDKEFRSLRTRIIDGGMMPNFSTISLEIVPPDSVNFFGAWSEVFDNEASFCHGLLGSEVLEEFTFRRNDSSSNWYLIDYYTALHD